MKETSKESSKSSSNSRMSKESQLMKQIRESQHQLDRNSYRIEVLERALRFQDMSQDERVKVEKELEDIKRILSTNQNVLRDLQKSGRQPLGFAFVIGVVCLFVYLMYCMATNPF